MSEERERMNCPLEICENCQLYGKCDEKRMIVRSEVRTFGEAMENKLRENDWKGGWEECNMPFLIQKLREEVRELEGMVGGRCRLCGEPLDPLEGSSDILSEAADVANFAMMIAINFSEEKKVTER